MSDNDSVPDSNIKCPACGNSEFEKIEIYSKVSRRRKILWRTIGTSYNLLDRAAGISALDKPIRTERCRRCKFILNFADD